MSPGISVCAQRLCAWAVRMSLRMSPRMSSHMSSCRAKRFRSPPWRPASQPALLSASWSRQGRPALLFLYTSFYTSFCRDHRLHILVKAYVVMAYVVMAEIAICAYGQKVVGMCDGAMRRRPTFAHISY